MARGKSSKKGNYVSKGQRPNVNKKLLNTMNREKSFDVNAVMTSINKRAQVIAKPQNDTEAKLAKRYMAENIVDIEVFRLLNTYDCCGLTKAGATQAVKTKRVEDLVKKWRPILVKWKKAQEKEEKNKYAKR